ncbi:2-isopropylmalate synthase [Marinobacterium arenosum]|uniref:2-isopropylmalate synthase n=1 Tax=Marinobacterium arenosum TaxID=2862496 RepID=UPI001C9451C7|nr:2-isopropylmalate synthase [Marinobacterium arenosum]MBY4676195.1 2-isopropylmalate synthase [Marinobacterium arenosum]
MFDHRKYRPFTPIRLTDRRWPDQQITAAPDWCSVDLRDGNQALVNPMNVAQKTRMFELLVKLGFKEIEVGFPSASQPDFDFVRKLIEEDRIPDDVTVQVLTQAREELISRTYEALAGVKQAIVHVYNSTSTVQREQVFGLNRDGIKAIAVQGARWVRDYAARYPATEWGFQYSPESFTGTELDYAVEVCDAVIEEWAPQNGQPVIINLPATVEMSTPNVFADQIEWFCRHLARRDQVRISLHTHNDRGCGVAAAELGVMAGADRIEGTLLGNGERTGNMDIVTMAMNLYSQGIDPKLDLSDIKEIIEVVEACTELPVAARHPWAGELVYTAFSGSHQDAIRKSINYHEEHNQAFWNVAYLPIDPRDIGREYEAVVRINSQSGKGGVALVLERDYGIELPKWMHAELSKVVQQAAEESGVEVSPANIKALYEAHFVEVEADWQLQGYDLHTEGQQVNAQFKVGSGELTRILSGQGAGAVEALSDALARQFDCRIEVAQFDEHAISGGTDAQALACIAAEFNGQRLTGVAQAEDTSAATLQAVLTAFARSEAANTQAEAVA